MKDSRRPNILLIVADEQCLSECGAYGPTPCKTPNLDRLAAESIVFENAYTPCPLCSPARGSILTGLYPHTHGVTCNTEDTGCCVQELYDSPNLLPRVMTRHGYSCGFTGKWHLGTSEGNLYNSGRKPAVPTDFGYEGYDFPGHGGIGIEYPEYSEYLRARGYEFKVDIKDDMQPLLYGICNVPEEYNVPAFITDHAIGMVDDFSKRDQPFFIHQNFWGPHQPYYVPQEALDLYSDVAIPEWDNFQWDPSAVIGPHQLRLLPNWEHKTWDDWEKLIRYKYAAATLIDNQIGRVIDHLRVSGLLDNTILIFTSDHGDHIGSRGGLLDKGFSHFEEVLHVPMMIRMPDGKPMRRSDFVSLVDIFSTVIDIAGAPVPVSHGRSLLNSTPKERDYVVAEFHGLNSIACSMRTIRKGTWKYGWNCVGKDELYNLEVDSSEMDNRIDDSGCAEVLRELREDILSWMVETEDPIKPQYARYCSMQSYD